MQRFWALVMIVALAAPGTGAWAGPLCACDHGPEVECECPHHAALLADELDEASLPPCHRGKKALRAPSAEKSADKSGRPCFKVKCGGRAPDLNLTPATVLPEPPSGELAELVPVAVHWRALPEAPPAPFLEHPRPPPRAG